MISSAIRPSRSTAHLTSVTQGARAQKPLAASVSRRTINWGLVLSSQVLLHKRVYAMSAESAAFDVAVKGDPRGQTLGDCPFCHRALLTLEEKHVPYNKTYVDFSNKPDWLFEVNPEGSVPVAKDLRADKWVVGSGEIADYVEDKFPEPKLGKSSDIPETGSKLFPAFVGFLKAKGDEAMKKRGVLVEELESLSKHLRDHGPYLCGNEVTAADLALAPKLYHAKVALKHFKDFDIQTCSENVSYVNKYLERMQGRDSWKHTFYGEDLVIKGWQKHVEG